MVTLVLSLARFDGELFLPDQVVLSTLIVLSPEILAPEGIICIESWELTVLARLRLDLGGMGRDLLADIEATFI